VADALLGVIRGGDVYSGVGVFHVRTILQLIPGDESGAK
jgi:hypothetical protein